MKFLFRRGLKCECTRSNETEEKAICQCLLTRIGTTDKAFIFDQMWKCTREHLTPILRGRGISLEDSNDILQEVAIKAFQKFDQFERGGEEGFRKWCHRIMVNILNDRQRKRNREQTICEQILDSVGHAEEFSNLLIRQQYMEKLMEMLPPNQATVLRLSWDGLTYEEIAKELDITVGQVRSYKHQACVKARKWWEVLI